MSEEKEVVSSVGTQTTAKVKTPRKSRQIHKMSSEELFQYAKQQEDKENANRELQKKKQAYQYERDDWMLAISLLASHQSKILKEFKDKAMSEFVKIYDDYFYSVAGEGKKKPSKITMINTLESVKIEFDAHDIMALDESANAAIAKIHAWLETKFKGREETKEAYYFINQALSKNRLGDYNPLTVYKLCKLKREGVVQDQEFLEAITILEDSQTITGSANYIRFYTKDSENKWERILLNFSEL